MADRHHRAEPTIWSRLVAAIIAVALAFGSLVLVSGRADAHLDDELKGVFREVGEHHLPRFPSDDVLNSVFGKTAPQAGVSGNPAVGGTPIVSTATRRLYQPYALADNTVGFLVRDLETLAVVGGFRMPAGIRNLRWFPQALARGSIGYAADPANKRMWFWTNLRPGDPNAQTLRHGMIVVQEADNLADYRTQYVPLGLALKDLSPGPLANEVLQDWLPWASDPLGGPIPPVPDPTSQLAGDPRLYTPEEPGSPDGFDFNGLTYTHGTLYAVLSETQSTEDTPVHTRLLEINPANLQLKLDRVVRSCPRQYPQQATGKISGYVPVIRTEDSVWLPCLSSGNPVLVKMPLATLHEPNGTEVPFTGTGVPFGYLADSTARRFHVRVQAPQGPAVLTFDVGREIFVGLNTVGTSGVFPPTAWGLDSSTGRVYVQSGPLLQYGLARIDGRIPRVPPAIRFEALPTTGDDRSPKTLARDPINSRLFALDPDDTEFIVLEDDPPAADQAEQDPDRTFQLDEAPGVTSVNFSGEANGYGVRQLFVGGLTGLVPNRVSGSQTINADTVRRPNCYFRDRELTMAEVTTAQIQNAQFGATSIAVDADEGSRLDVAFPERCAEVPNNALVPLPTEEQAINDVKKAYRDAFQNSPWLVNILDQYVGGTLDGANRESDKAINGEDADGDGVDETPGALDRIDPARQPWYFGEAACRPDSPNPTVRPSGTVGDPALSNFEATVNCTNPRAVTASASTSPPDMPALPEQAQAALRMLPDSVEGGTNSAASAASTVSAVSASTHSTTYLDPERGTVARTESLVRGVTITFPGFGTLYIGGIHSVAESYAQGRTGTNGTSFERMLWGVRGVFASGEVNCDLCRGDKDMQALADGLNRALGDRGTVRIPRADADYLVGTPKGYQAAIQRHPDDLLNNEVLNGDSNAAVPAIELLLYNDSINWGRQRQIFQFAGTLANSQYGIICAKGVPQGNTCVQAPRTPGSLTVSLTDGKRPLAGGEFTASGPTTKSCTTGGDGRCSITDITPGSYVVKETKTPAGYVTAKDLKVTMSGFAQTVNFVNLKNEAFIEITLHEASSGAPLPGGVFEVINDADGDGAVGPKEKAAAACTTEGSGDCPLALGGEPVPSVPLGSYVVVQRVAPKGYQVVDPVAFTLTLPGDVARLAFTNGVGGTSVLSLNDGNQTPIANSGPTDDNGSGGFFGAVSDALGWALRHPLQALVFAAASAVFISPLWAAWRRRLLIWAEATVTV